jgi:cysteine dioxygenase
MRILKGSLLETRYATPTEDVVKPLEKIGERLYREGEVAYMADELGVHRISDPDEREVAVSLHRKSQIPFCYVYFASR